MKFRNILTFLFFVSFTGFSQTDNYDAINIQGQFLNQTGSVSLEFYLISGSDTLWHEQHNDVALGDNGNYHLMLGKGLYIGGTVSEFNLINWFDLSELVIWRTDLASPVEIGSLQSFSVPYTFHSITVEAIPASTDLSDGISPASDNIVRWNGTEFYTTGEWQGDTAIFAYHGYSSGYADTVDVCDPSGALIDSAGYSIYADSVVFAPSIGTVVSVDSAAYCDTTDDVEFSLGNWALDGNSGLSGSNFAGTTNSEAFNFGTNNQVRIKFDDPNEVSMNYSGPGFRVYGSSGVNFNMNSGETISYIPNSHLYLKGTGAVSGGVNNFLLDTVMGANSFSWGDHVGTTGEYSAVFGQGTRGDSTFVGGVNYGAIAGLAAGRNCNVSYNCIAIGDNCTANYYRNIAIGKNVTSNTYSAGCGIGNNVLATGPTAWALGNYVQARGNSSTALGSRVSDNGLRGCFLFGDNSTLDTMYASTHHQFNVRAAGGVVFWTDADTTVGVELNPGGGSWLVISDRNKKENIDLLNGPDYSGKFLSLPVYSWSYKNNEQEHIGPMAQDLYDHFEAGEMDTRINMLDYHGITFLGIKALHEKLKEEEIEAEEIESVSDKIDEEQRELNELEERTERLYEKVNH